MRLSFSVLKLAVAEIIVWAGMYYMFPALFFRWERETDWSKADLSLAFTLAVAMSAISAPLFGSLVDRGFGRHTLTLSAGVGALAIIAMSQVHALWQFYVVWFVLGIAMGGCLYEVSFAYVTRYLAAQSRKAITRISIIAGFAGSLSFPSAHYLSEWFGWRFCLLLFAGAILLIAVPLFWSCRLDEDGIADNPPANTNAGKVVAKTMLTSPMFWLLSSGFALIALNHGMIISHVIPLLTERNLPTATAVLIASLIGPMQVIGRLAMTALESRITVAKICAVSFVAMFMASLFLFGVSALPLLAFVFVVLQGAGYGVTSITRPVVTADVLGRGNFGVISGMQATLFMGATAAAPLLAALLWQVGGYDLVIITTAVAALSGLLVFALATKLNKTWI